MSRERTIVARLTRSIVAMVAEREDDEKPGPVVTVILGKIGGKK